MGTIREPQKVNSIEKKNKIIDAGLMLFSKIGYNKATTPLIAKEAGVSTGIVYQYFKDKKDILLYAINRYFEQDLQGLSELLEEINESFEIESSLNKIIDLSIKNHKSRSLAHAEMIAMSHIDNEVHEIFVEGEHKIIKEMIIFLEHKLPPINNLCEKVHIAYKTIESLCHEIVFYKHDDVDYNIMINETIRLITYLFK